MDLNTIVHLLAGFHLSLYTLDKTSYFFHNFLMYNLQKLLFFFAYVYNINSNSYFKLKWF